MDLTLSKQRQDVDEASRFLQSRISEMDRQRKVLDNAFNSIDKNQENILESGSILAQETRKIMRELRNWKH